ncbi:MAG TPA: PQQ-dependent sugar dehydrogenase [Microlunatus sp.]|nr:PQQ-dependent sugar dehydrogenase [Microlunatus sp.]
MRSRTLRTCLRTGLVAVTAAVVTLAGGVAPPSADAAAPRLAVTKVAGNLTVPWDVTWVGSLMLFDQRPGGVWSKRGSAAPKRVSMALPTVFAHGESGMLGMVADPKASKNRYFYTCIAVATASGRAKGVEVWKWRLTSDTRAVKVKVLLTGLPLTSGRHAGCRLRFRSASMLYIGTGDAAVGTNPQSLSSLGGKVLRIRADGSVPKTNPFYRKGGKAKYVWTYGHRNVQGLALRPGGQLWSAEHGTSRDDEVNRVLKGRNYGWSPTPGYNEKRSMTDKSRFPKAYGARWRSGSPTVATSGATFLTGKQWKSWNGRLAVAMLKGQGVKLFTVSSGGKITGQSTILKGHGRIRTVQQGPDGSLYVTTSKGSGDAIYRVTPR